MLKTAGVAILTKAIGRMTGKGEVGALPTTLIGTGASLVFTRGRRPIGIVLLAAGGYLIWREAQAGPDRAVVRRP